MRTLTNPDAIKLYAHAQQFVAATMKARPMGFAGMANTAGSLMQSRTYAMAAAWYTKAAGCGGHTRGDVYEALRDSALEKLEAQCIAAARKREMAK